MQQNLPFQHTAIVTWYARAGKEESTPYPFMENEKSDEYIPSDFFDVFKWYNYPIRELLYSQTTQTALPKTYGFRTTQELHYSQTLLGFFRPLALFRTTQELHYSQTSNYQKICLNFLSQQENSSYEPLGSE